jgi:hypothetical protein
VLPRNQAQPGSKISALAKGDSVADGRNERGRNQRSEARDFHETATCIILFCDSLKLGVGLLDPLIQFVPFVLQFQNQLPESAR